MALASCFNRNKEEEMLKQCRGNVITYNRMLHRIASIDSCSAVLENMSKPWTGRNLVLLKDLERDGVSVECLIVKEDNSMSDSNNKKFVDKFKGVKKGDIVYSVASPRACADHNHPYRVVEVQKETHIRLETAPGHPAGEGLEAHSVTYAVDHRDWAKPGSIATVDPRIEELHDRIESKKRAIEREQNELSELEDELTKLG